MRSMTLFYVLLVAVTALSAGRHVNHGGVPLANLYLSLLDRVGVKLDRVADSTDRLPQLTA